MTNNNLKVFITIAITLLPIILKAQIVNCNGFLKGNYIEAGVNWNGSFGSSTRPPAGYHPQMQSSLHNAAACGGAITTDSSIGFVADPDKDGWGVGTIPHFGDYVLPGSPQEGWSYFADGVQTDAWNQLSATADSLTNATSSSVQAYSDTLGVRQIKTQAIQDGIYITQFYSLDTSKLFINIEVLVENTNLSTASNIFYMRTINPHNDQTFSSVAATNNKIEYTLPDTLNRSVVSARGTVYGNAYIALASQDNRAQPFIYKNGGAPSSTTIDNIFAGDANYLYNKNDSNSGNTSIGLIFSLGNLPSGGQVHFNYIYAFHPSVIDSTLNIIDSHVAVRNVYPQAFKVYPNPVINKFQVSGLQAGDALAIYDMIGKKVLDFGATTNQNHFNMEGLQSGYYLLVITDKYGTIIGREPLRKE